MCSVCVYVCVYTHMPWSACGKPENNLEELVLSSHCVGFGYWTQVFRLGNQSHYLLSHLSRPTDNVLLNQPDSEELL